MRPEALRQLLILPFIHVDDPADNDEGHYCYDVKYVHTLIS